MGSCTWSAMSAEEIFADIAEVFDKLGGADATTVRLQVTRGALVQLGTATEDNRSVLDMLRAKFDKLIIDVAPDADIEQAIFSVSRSLSTDDSEISEEICHA